MNKFRDLVSIDKYRFNELYEIFQYCILYTIVTIIWGFYLNRLFPPEDESKEGYVILFEIVLQALVVAVSVFYIRKLCQIIPLLINFKGYSQNKTSEYGGAVIISIVFMTTQKHIINKNNLLNRRYLS
jgi:hypothetical protein